jgi:hypothetical protein
MSMTTGLIAIKGRHVDKLAEIFNFFSLVDTGNDSILTNWEQASQVIDDEYKSKDDHSQRRIVWIDNRWTIIEDFSFILCTDETAMEAISRHLSTPVFALVTQGTSSNYAFWYFDKQKLRSFWIDNGKVTDNYGTPLPQEANFSFDENAFYDDIHGLAKKLGIDIENTSHLDHFVVKQLDNSEELDQKIKLAAENYQQPDNSTKSKPWWKFW